MERKHILLCGDSGSGKSTLIARLTEQSRRPVYGFVTKMLPADADGFHPVYMHPASVAEKDRSYGAENLIGRCDSHVHRANASVFDGLGTGLIRAARPDGVLVMDELGFMEADAPLFTKTVLEALEGDIPILAAVKTRYDVPFLNAVRASEKAQVYPVTERSREQLFAYLLDLLRRQGML